MHYIAFIVSKNRVLYFVSFYKRSIHQYSGPMFSFNFSSHMQLLVQTEKMDKLKQEVHELREEVTTLRAEVENLINLVSSLTVTQNHPQVDLSTKP